jgi:hypothetical protein
LNSFIDPHTNKRGKGFCLDRIKTHRERLRHLKTAEAAREIAQEATKTGERAIRTKLPHQQAGTLKT